MGIMSGDVGGVNIVWIPSSARYYDVSLLICGLALPRSFLSFTRGYWGDGNLLEQEGDELVPRHFYESV